MYKSKATKKKTKKATPKSMQYTKAIDDPRIQRIKLIKSGDLRRRSGMSESLAAATTKKYRAVIS